MFLALFYLALVFIMEGILLYCFTRYVVLTFEPYDGPRNGDRSPKKIIAKGYLRLKQIGLPILRVVRAITNCGQFSSYRGAMKNRKTIVHLLLLR